MFLNPFLFFKTVGTLFRPLLVQNTFRAAEELFIDLPWWWCFDLFGELLRVPN
jgi:hypothetical protein